MRLSEWRKTAPTKESMGSRVLPVLASVLVDLGAGADPECWVAWGDDPETRYSVLAPTVAGLVSVAVRPAGPDEAPRATARLIRWPKLVVSELAVEAGDGHRLVAVQVEAMVLKGVDGEADRICEFVRGLIAGIDNRNPAPVPIAVAQGATAGGPVVVRAVASREAPAAAPTRPKAASGRVVAARKTAASPKPKRKPPATVPPAPASSQPSFAAAPVPKPAPGLSKAAPKKPATPATGKPARSMPIQTLLLAAGVQAPPPAPEPTPGAAAANRKAPEPVAVRAAAIHYRGKPAARPIHAAPEPAEPEADRSTWISPHPIEEPPVHDPARPRPWKP